MTSILYIEYSTQDLIDPTIGDIAFLNWISPYTVGVTDLQQQVINIVPGTPNLSATPFPTFPDKDTARAYYQTTFCNQMVTDVNNFYGVVFYAGYDVESVDSATNARFAALATVANTGSYTDLINQPSLSGTRTQSALSLSLVGTGATGTQIDATHDATINVTVSTSATASIAGAATSLVALKICATNNATEGSWTTVSTQETDQNVSLAITLQSITAQKGQLTTLVPAGWYAKLVNSGTGTHAEAFVSGQKVVYS